MQKGEKTGGQLAGRGTRQHAAPMEIDVRVLAGEEIIGAAEDLARLRMAVFAEWPYLYDGDVAYEREYLREFVAAEGSVLVAACQGAQIVGAATASPMAAQKLEFREPFEARGIDTSRLTYFGESVLLPDYRGQGIGHAFFDHREALARDFGANAATFAGIVRPEGHPAQPPGYRSLDAFWRKRGYEPVEGLVTQFAWKEHAEHCESPKPMQFWLRKFI